MIATMEKDDGKTSADTFVLDTSRAEQRIAEWARQNEVSTEITRLWVNDALLTEPTTFERLSESFEGTSEPFRRMGDFLVRDQVVPRWKRKKPRSTLDRKQREARAKKNRAQRAARKAHRQKSWGQKP